MTREEKEYLLSKIWDMPKPKDDSNYWQGVDDVADLISNMPITEREKGEWIRNGGHILAPVYRCSNCNKKVAIIWGEEYKCCPHCIADMRGELNE